MSRKTSGGQISPVGLYDENGNPINTNNPLQVSGIGSGEIIGNVAHNAIDSGNPIKIGGYASSTPPTNVDETDRVNAWFQLNGAQAVYNAYALNTTDDAIRSISPLIAKQFTPVMSATPDYGAGDLIGTINTLSSVMEPDPDGGASVGRAAKLISIHAVDRAGQAPTISLYFFKTTPSGGTYTDNVALAWGAGDHNNKVGVVTIGTANWKTLAGVSDVTMGAIDQIHLSDTDSIFVLVVADGVYNGASTGDLTITCNYQRG